MEENSVDIVAAHDSVRDALTYLTSSKVKSFFARVINALEKIPAPGLGTMGVTQMNGRYVLLYDPSFALKVGQEELLATLEHECLHIILGHLPRYMQLRAVYSSISDKKLFDMTANIAADLADNQLLVKDYRGIEDQENKPLGYWVLPTQFDPPMPRDMDYETYHKLTLDTMNNRLKTQPNKLYELANKMLEERRKALQQAMQSSNADPQQEEEKKGDGKSQESKCQQPGSGEPQQGKGKGQQPGSGEPQQGKGKGQQPGSGEPQQGKGKGQQPGSGEPQQGQSGGSGMEDIQKELENLDPVEQKLLEMIVQSSMSHMGWKEAAENASAGDRTKLKNHGKEVVKSTVQSHKKDRGTLPSHMEQLIQKMLMPPEIPWEELLHQVVQNTRQRKPKRGMRRANKKLAAMQHWLANAEKNGRLPATIRTGLSRKMSVFPGTSYDKKFTILFSLDTSGSMSERELKKGLSELQAIQKADSDVKIVVMYVDADVAKEYEIGPTDEIDFAITGRGGTDFEPAFKRAEELLRVSDKAPDIMVYATDGYAPAPKTKLPIPVVWLITPGGPIVTKDAGHITIEMKNKHLGDSTDYDGL